ncbi:MAG: DNA recombination protein RmuC [Pseudomonadota bacterium]
MGLESVIFAIVALAIGALVGWLLGGRAAAAVRADLAAVQVRADQAELLRKTLDEVEREREAANATIAGLRADHNARTESFEAQLRQLTEAKDALGAQFAETAAKLLDTAQRQFLERADERFKQSEATTGQGLKALLAPVNERLARYEEGVAKVEAERRDAFGELKGQIEAMRLGTERVSGEAAKLVNALRNAPKARGRWGEQQLRNVLESCGLSEYADFQTEVSVVDGDGGRLRPDVVIRVPGGQSLVIDAKVSLNAYQDAFGAVDEAERQTHLTAHTASMRNHINALGNKSYWGQFADAPDYVIMFVPGEHFLAAALEHDHGLWDFAFEKKVLLATPTNLIAIARTVSAVWRQEKLAGQAREIADLGKELYARLATMGSHVGRLGKNLDTAVGAYNAFVGSLETNVLTQAKRFEALNVDTGGKLIEPLPVVEQATRPMVKLVASSDGGGAVTG